MSNQEQSFPTKMRDLLDGYHALSSDEKAARLARMSQLVDAEKLKVKESSSS